MYDYRTTFNSYAKLDLGWPDAVAAEYLGHNIEVNRDHYTSVQMRRLIEFVKRGGPSGRQQIAAVTPIAPTVTKFP